MISSGIVPQMQPNLYSVFKTHSSHFKLPENATRDTLWLFATTSLTESDPRRVVSELSGRLRWPVKLAQSTLELSKLGSHAFAARYADLFELSERQLYALLHYIRYWDILRQCCGTQMSEVWRTALLKNDSRASPRGSPHWPGPVKFPRTSDSPAHPSCEMYELDAVEAALMQTDVYRRFGGREKRIRSVSDLDGDFSGTYCSASNRAIAALHLEFNANLSVTM